MMSARTTSCQIANTTPRVAILGVSTRAAAMSAVRAGYAPLAADMFADADLCQLAAVWTFDAWPPPTEVFPECLAGIPWLYTGGIENWPKLVDGISQRHPLWGNRAEVLHAARDPLRLRTMAREAGIAYPEVALTSQELPTDGSWLLKPLRSGGGLGIIPWRGIWPSAATSAYFQRRVAGRPLGATYVATRNGAHLLGACEMWQQFAPANSATFHYAGSWGPIELSPALCEQLQHMGTELAARLQLIGLFGIDCIAVGEQLYLLEVNPRYTASVELLERAAQSSALRLHIAACTGAEFDAGPFVHTPAVCHGKTVLYAHHDLEVTSAQSGELMRWAGSDMLPAVADIPRGSTTVPAGAPLVTVLASGADEQQIRDSLTRLAHRVRRIVDDASRET